MLLIDPFTSCADPKYLFLPLFGCKSVVKGLDRILAVHGGVPPYTWAVTGSDFELVYTETTAQINTIRTTASAVIGESTALVTITDDCNTEIEILITCCEGLLNSGGENLEEICGSADYSFEIFEAITANPGANNSEVLRVIGGIAPFTWVSSNPTAGYFASAQTNVRVNTIRFDYSLKNDLQYTVTDACGNTVNGTILGDNSTFVWGCSSANLIESQGDYSEGDTTGTPSTLYPPIVPTFVDGYLTLWGGVKLSFSVVNNDIFPTSGQFEFIFRLSSFADYGIPFLGTLTVGTVFEFVIDANNYTNVQIVKKGPRDYSIRWNWCKSGALSTIDSSKVLHFSTGYRLTFIYTPNSFRQINIDGIKSISSTQIYNPLVGSGTLVFKAYNYSTASIFDPTTYFDNVAIKV